MKKIKNFLFAAFLMISLTAVAYAKETNTLKSVNDTTRKLSDTVKLGEVTISGFRIDRKIKDLPASVSITRSAEYQKRSAISLSSVLNSEPGITSGGDGIWSTNINIRGLGENRFVTLIDGNRVETATDLTASLSMIDVNDIERVEVFKGAQSSLYGTGAMGGIVNIITKDGGFDEKFFLSGGVISGYASANKMYSASASLSTGSRIWYVRANGSYFNASDMRTPKGVLPNSQFKMGNLSVKAGLTPYKNHLLKVQIQRNSSWDVGIPGGESFPGPAEATYKDITRELLSASYEITNISKSLSSLKVSYFDQFINRDVELKPNTVTETTLPNGNTQRTTPVLFTPGGKHHTNGLRVQGTLNLAKNNTLIAGADIWGRTLTTTREKYITVNVISKATGQVITTKNLVRGETPIPKSRFGSTGIFIQNETRMLDGKLILIAGGRADRVKIENEAGYDLDYLTVNGERDDTPPNQRKTFDEGLEKSLSWSANVGLLYKVTKTADFTLNVARSFRAPSLEERFKYIDLGNFVRLGNASLYPERGYSADLGFRVWGKDVTLTSSLFINHITNMIAETPGEFIYTITDVSEPDTLPAFINSNISKALLYGFDFKLDYSISSKWLVFISGAYVRGKVDGTGKNLPLIPPLNGRTGINYTNSRYGTVELSLSGAARQNLVADGEKESAGYLKSDLAINTKRILIGKTTLQIFFGVDNLFDTNYSNHLSTNRGAIDIEPGRNIYTRFSFSF
ncbi:MAG: TonB-dependent receptor [Bacteroidales bacterium]